MTLTETQRKTLDDKGYALGKMKGHEKYYTFPKEGNHVRTVQTFPTAQAAYNHFIKRHG